MKSVLLPDGYNSKASTFWKIGKELTILINVQKSRWGDGIYINYGATPNEMMVQASPPPIYCWGTQRRAESEDFPFQEFFRRLASGYDEDLSPEEAADAMEGLRDLLKDSFENADVYRRELLQKYPDHEAGSFFMIDWANNVLRSPKFYFEEKSYFNKSP